MHWLEMAGQLKESPELEEEQTKCNRYPSETDSHGEVDASLWNFTLFCLVINQHTKELISARKTSQKHEDRSSSKLVFYAQSTGAVISGRRRPETPTVFSPGMRTRTRKLFYKDCSLGKFRYLASKYERYILKLSAYVAS